MGNMSGPDTMSHNIDMILLGGNCSLQGAIRAGLFQSTGNSPRMECILATAKEVCAAVAYLHDMGVLHGDLKSTNVLLKSSATTRQDARGFIAKVSQCSNSLWHRKAVTQHLEFETGKLLKHQSGFPILWKDIHSPLEHEMYELLSCPLPKPDMAGLFSVPERAGKCFCAAEEHSKLICALVTGF